MPMNMIEIFFGGILSSGLVLSAAVYLFKIAFEKRLEQEIERFKDELKKKLEAIKSDLRIGEAQEDAKFRQLIELRARQLSDFYWPLYIGLQKDNVIWRRILDKRDAADKLRQRVGAVIERDVVLPNHDKLVLLIEKNIHLAEADEQLEGHLLHFIRHVAIYKSIRAAGEEMLFPIEAGEEWPKELFPSVERRMRELQQDYNRLLRIQEKSGEMVA